MGYKEEARRYVEHSKQLEIKNEQLQAENKQLRKDISGWLNWCYYLPESWKPKPMIEKSTQTLKK